MRVVDDTVLVREEGWCERKDGATGSLDEMRDCAYATMLVGPEGICGSGSVMDGSGRHAEEEREGRRGGENACAGTIAAASGR